MNQRDEDVQFQHATTEAFKIDVQPFAGPGANFDAALKSKPFEPDGSQQDPIMTWFGQPKQQTDEQAVLILEIRRQTQEYAQWIAKNLPRGPERTTALRKLLESKDAAVRAALG